MFNRVDSARTTRRTMSKNVKVPRVDSETGRKGFSFRGPVFWNNIDSDLKDKENKNVFKSAYLKELLQDVNHPG